MINVTGYDHNFKGKFRLRMHYDNLIDGSQETEWHELESIDKINAIIESRKLISKYSTNDPRSFMPFRGAVLVPVDPKENYIYCFKVR